MDTNLTKLKLPKVQLEIDPYNLQRFIDAQDKGYKHGCSLFDGYIELKNEGTKTKHWIWYGFPQLLGIKKNATNKAVTGIAKKFSLENFLEAKAYYRESTQLKPNLITLTKLVRKICNGGKTLYEVVKSDNVKFVSSMTLFLIVSMFFNDKQGELFFIGVLNDTNYKKLCPHTIS